MKEKKVTIQDIADSLHLSRATVSKALNGNGKVSAETKEAIIKRVSEMKYKQFSFLDFYAPAHDGAAHTHAGSFAMLAHVMPDKFHIGSSILASLEQEIRQQGYALSIHILTDTDIESLRLPNNFDPQTADAVICIELFDKPYSKMVCGLGKPVLFTDAFYDYAYHGLDADILMMENRNSIRMMADTIVKRKQLWHVGFMGAIHHCLSFYERWQGFCDAMAENSLPVDEAFCLIDDADSLFWDDHWLTNQLKGMRQLPDLFVCANDSLALRLISILKSLGYAVPGDVLVSGFDDMPEARIVEPHLTTVHVPSNSMGTVAAQRLLARIANPTLPFITTYVHTKIKYRASTGV